MSEFSPKIKDPQTSQEATSKVNTQSDLLANSGKNSLRRLPVQPKLRIGSVDDPLEREADSMADRVMRMPEPFINRASNNEEEEKKVQTKPLAAQITPFIQCQVEKEEEEPVQASFIQKQTDDEEESIQTKIVQPQPEEEEEPVQAKLIQKQPEEEEKPIQAKLILKQANEEDEPVQAKRISRKGNNSTPGNSSWLENQLRSSNGSGSPLPETTKTSMESRFGADFNNVRIHTGSHAAQMNKDLNAQAFTHGNDIYFNSGKYSPESQSGKQLLAHELAHIIQQGSSESKPVKEKKVQRSPVGTETEPSKTRGPSKPLYKIDEVLQTQYSHLDKVLTKNQKEKIKALSNYYKKLEEIEKRLAKIEYVFKGGRGYASEDEAEINRLHKQRNDLYTKIESATHVSIDIDLLIEKKSMAIDKSATTSKYEDESQMVIDGYKNLLYRTLLLQPTFLKIKLNNLVDNPRQFIKIIWSRNQWELPHNGGLITFNDLMRIEVFNLEYQTVLIKSSLETLRKMQKLAELVSAGKKRDPDDPMVLSMSRKQKMMKALEYSVDHFSAVDAAKRVFGSTPKELAFNIGVMIGSIIALIVVGSIGPIGALISGGIALTLLIIFGVDTIKTVIRAFKNLYSNADDARNQKDLEESGKQFAQEGGEAALKVLLLIVSGKVVRKFGKQGKVVSSKKPGSVFHHTRSLEEIIKPVERKVPLPYTLGLLNRVITGSVVLGGAEGSVYVGTRLQMTGFQKALMGLLGKYPNVIEFKGPAARIFTKHPVEGWYSGIKRLTGQYKAPMGDIKFKIDGVKNFFNPTNPQHLILTEVELVPLKGAARVVGQMRYLSRVVILEVVLPLIFVYKDTIGAWIANVMIKTEESAGKK